MLASLVLFENEFLNIVSISFSALVLNELIMVAVEITTWHMLMVVSEVITLALYVVSILFLPEYFGACLCDSVTSREDADSKVWRRRCARPRVRVDAAVRLEGFTHRRHLGRAVVDHQVPQGQVCADAVCETSRLLNMAVPSSSSVSRLFFFCFPRPVEMLSVFLFCSALSFGWPRSSRGVGKGCE